MRDGAKTLDDALKIVERERLQNQTAAARMTRMRGQYPDLADLVDEERLSLEGAEHEANNRDATLKDQRDSAVNLVDQWFAAALTFGANDALLNDKVVIKQVAARLTDRPQIYRSQLLEGCKRLQAAIRRMEK